MKYTSLTKYFVLIFAFICLLWLISLFEIYNTISNGIAISNLSETIFYKGINDFWFGILIGLILFPVYFLLTTIYKKHSDKLIKFILVFLILVQFSLVKYSLTTLVNLGADLLGYSVNDIYDTVTMSTGISVTYFLPFIILPLLFLGLNYVINRFLNNRELFGLSLIMILVFGSSKLVFSNSSEISYVNKMYFFAKDVIRYQNETRALNSYDFNKRNDYPLLQPFENTEDVLAPFFNINTEKPNVVFIIVEGLGGEFVGGKNYSGFTPYIDSLITKSLYWENFISTTGRTFGVLPSLLGSLPFGEKGFLEIPKTPSHFSLLSVLKTNGYTTSFYEGHQSSFDRKINFLEYNEIDKVIDENKFGSDFKKTEGNSAGFSWGYPDSEIFRKTLSSIDSTKQPRLDVIMTLSNHEPFQFPLKEKYIEKVDSIIASSNFVNGQGETINSFKEIFASLLYTDNSIKNFIEAYKKRPEYKNTIFIITGDHRLIPVTQKDKLCRFHVPLLIYSPLLKHSENFKSISSHWDITPSLLAFLMNNYNLNKMDKVSWMSKGLDTAKQFRNIHQIPLMRYKGNVNDFIYEDILYSDGELYKIKEDFGTYKIKEDNLLKVISDSLMEFKKLNAYLTQRNKIFPDSLNIYTEPSFEFSEEQLSLINSLTKNMNFDQIFMLARDKAFKKDYKTARLLCDHILNEFPNYFDARTLKGRTLAWEKMFSEAEVELLNVLNRSPFYEDSYLALLDLYWWSNQDEKAIEISKIAEKNKLQNANFSFKLAKAYQRLNEVENAHKLMDSLINLYPDNVDYINFKQTLK